MYGCHSTVASGCTGRHTTCTFATSFHCVFCLLLAQETSAYRNVILAHKRPESQTTVPLVHADVAQQRHAQGAEAVVCHLWLHAVPSGHVA